MNKKPWSIGWTQFGESMGYDSQTRIIDADGRHIVTVGSGTNDRNKRIEEEALARLIVDAVNSYK